MYVPGLVGSLSTDSLWEVTVYSRRFTFGIMQLESFGAWLRAKEHVRKPQDIVSLCGDNLQGAWIAVMVHCCLLYVWLCINSSICLLWLPWLLNTYTQGHFDIVKFGFWNQLPSLKTLELLTLVLLPCAAWRCMHRAAGVSHHLTFPC